MIRRRDKLMYLALLLVLLPLCNANECLEAVEEACHEVIVENNDQLLETMEEMVANRSCDVSNQFRGIKDDLENTMKQHFEQLYLKLADSMIEEASTEIPVVQTEALPVPTTTIQSDQPMENLEREDCTGDGYFKQLVKLAKTCDDLARCGLTESGRYELDPDGPMIGKEPISVYCNFATNSTVIKHNGTNEVTLENCDSGSGCASVNVSYEAHMNQIRSIMDHSSYCQQEIVFSCNIAPLVFNDVSFASWRYRNNETNEPITQGNADCKCNDDNTCMDVTATCNCYSKLRFPLQDTIRITDQNKLPVTGFAYGPFTHQNAQAAVQLKSLECFGPPNVASITRDDCGAVKILSNSLLRFDLEYSSNRGECYTEISFESYVQLKLTVLKFESNHTSCKYLEIYEGPEALRSKITTFGTDNSKTKVSHEWSGKIVSLKTDLGHNEVGSVVTAFIYF